MKCLWLVILGVSACLPATPTEKTGEAPTANVAPDGGVGALGFVPGTEGTRFLARTPGTQEEWDLRLKSFAVDVEAGPIVTRSHLTLVVENPGQRQVEAYFRLPLPPGAAVTRAVLLVDDRRMEGAFVSAERAGQIYRSITERRRDPALITWVDRNFIDVSVFPVEPQNHRQLELEWVEPTATADAGVWYRVPFLAKEKGKALWPHALVVNGKDMGVATRPWLLLPLTGNASLAMGRLPGEPHAYAIAPAQNPDGKPKHILFVAETTRATRPPDRAKQRYVMEKIARELPDTARLSLLAVDFLVHPLLENQSPADFTQGLHRLDDLPSLGALDLGQAIARASDMAESLGADQVVYLGSGRDAFKPDAAVASGPRKIGPAWFVMGEGEPSAILVELARLNRGRVIGWRSVSQGIADLRTALDRRPSILSGRAGESVHPLETVTGQTRWLHRFAGGIPGDSPRVPGRDLEALWARAHGESVWLDRDVGTRHRVVTPTTSILVLEKNADYGRWGIPQPDVVDEAKIKATGADRNPGILGVLKATDSKLGSLFASDTADPRLGKTPMEVLGNLGVGEANGIGGLGLTGTWGGGWDVNPDGRHREREGKMGKKSNRRVSTVTLPPGQVSVRGALDKEIIRRVARLHLNEVRYCYDSEYHWQAGVSERLVIQWVIAPTGQVVHAYRVTSTLNNARLEGCVLNAIKRWEFPRPNGGGIVVVKLPFQFGKAGGLDNQDDKWTSALAIYRGNGLRFDRLATLATIVQAPSQDPLALAWWIVEHHLHARASGSAGYLLAANLLRDEGVVRDAIRVLSEWAPGDASLVARELRAWGKEIEAKRIETLAKLAEREP